MQKKRNAIMAVLAVALVAALTIGGTLAYMTDSESLLNTFKVGDLDISIDEPSYKPCKEEDDRVPGDSFPKDPTVKLWQGEAYMRVLVEFYDIASGALITDADRLALIWHTLYYDKNFSTAPIGPGGKYAGSSNLMLWYDNTVAHPINNEVHKNYTKDYLYGAANGLEAKYPGQFSSWYNKFDFELQTVASGKYYLNYKNSGSNDIFTMSAGEVKVFTSVVFPSDWNQTEMRILQGADGYKIKFTVQAIQAQGFANRTQAFEALDKEFSDGTAWENYEVTSNNRP